jgi:multidrug efflux pump subunit AcrA (membrane-fusion protein)
VRDLRRLAHPESVALGLVGNSSVSTACSSAMADYEASADTLSADMAILDGKISIQDSYLKDLDSAIVILDKLVDQLQSAAASNASGSNQPTAPSGSSRPTGGASRPTGGANQPNGNASRPTGNANQPTGSANRPAQNTPSQATSEPASAAQLAADQATIDAAQAALTAARQDLAAATLKSPAAGKVAAIGLTAGTSSSGKTITIVGTGVQGIDVNVPLSQVNLVKVGQSVSVAVDGVAKRLHGTVESVGLLSSTSGSTTTFPLTVRLDSSSPRLFDGTGADVVITTGTASKAITVPNSAIRSTVGGGHTVTVLSGGKTTTVRVTLGVAGNDITQVKSGLKVGDQVVLADLSQPLPSSSTNGSNNSRFRFPVFGTAGGPNGGGPNGGK